MIIVNKHIRRIGIRGIALVFVIIVSTQKEKQDKVLINHEKIHLKQQWEMLVLPFFFWYIAEYIINRIKGMDDRAAYRAISFEREAKENERNLLYLSVRRFWAWINYC